MGKENTEDRSHEWDHCTEIRNPAHLAAVKPGLYRINVELLRPRKGQPRLKFDKVKLDELASSLNNSSGLITPIIAQIKGSGGGVFAEIVDGERRWRAAKSSGHDTVLCVVRAPHESEKDLYTDSYIANTHRQNLNPIEEALALRILMALHNCNQTQLAKVINRSPFFISNAMQYLELHPDIQKLLLEDKLNKGTAKLLAAYPQDKQKILVNFLLAAVVKKGRPLSQGEINFILRRESEKRKIPKRVPNTKKGRVHQNSSSLLVNRITSLAGQLKETLEEVAKVSRSEVVENSTFYLNVMAVLNGLFPSMERGRARGDEDAT